MDTTSASPLVVVDCDGSRAAWDGRAFTGDEQIVSAAIAAARYGQVVDIIGKVPVRAGADTALAAAAALCAYSPGRTLLVDNPPEVAAYLDSALAAGAELVDED